jgi:K+-transporting ATPase KdpF subunit
MPSGQQARGRAAAMSASDLFGLIVSAIVCIYLLYALLRGEKF